MEDLINLLASVVALGLFVWGLWRWLWQRRQESWGQSLLVFVSMGGTCRDPMAKAIADRLMENRNPKIDVRAAGILKGHTKGATSAARRVVEENLKSDVLRSHRSRKLDRALLRRARLILTMSEDNKKQILKVWPDAASKVYTIKEFFGKNGDIANPFIADDPSSDAALTRYRRCYRELYALLSAKGNIDKLYDAVIK